MSDSLTADLGSAFKNATKGWKTAKKRADRVSGHGLDHLRHGTAGPSIRDAAFDVMEDAYLMASGNDRYLVNARQVMYAARPMVLKLTIGKLWASDTYFMQTILTDYLEEYEPGWKIFWDARGHLHEPHTNHAVDLGGIAVMKYVGGWQSGFDVTPKLDAAVKVSTKGPGLRFNTVLWIEKEGFAPILKDAGFAERYDMEIMSTKGMTTKAAVELARHFESEGVRILMMHDFDKSGFEIVKTIRRGTRLLFTGASGLVDLGLRLEDVEGLEPEPVTYRQQKDPRRSLRDCGTTTDEANFLVEAGDPWSGWSGQRVELNAMTSDQLVNWVEQKLDEHGVEKVVPDEDVLARGYRRALVRARVAEVIEEFTRDMDDVEPPGGLHDRVREHLEGHPSATWDDALAEIVASDENGGGT